jgi:ubiquinone biosynthesis protein
MPSLLNTVRDIDRLRQITQVLARHGFGELIARTDLATLVPFRKLDEEPTRVSVGVRMRLALQELGPSFVKLGQILSTRADLLPPDIIHELKKLQEDVPPVPFDDVARQVEESLGAKLGDVFAEFDDHPIASASIGQVHRARLRTPGGDVDVAVKVQRPRIRATIERDLDLLYLMARLLERAVPESSVYSPTGLVAEFDRAITAELDYTIEAQNAERFIRNFAGNEHVRFPKVYREASAKKVLCADYLDGLKLEDAIDQGYSGQAIAKHALQVLIQMIYLDGFFHADPHPGNIRILGTAEAPVLGMFDLGLVGHLSPEMREKAISLMIAVVRKDTDELAEALLAMGRPRSKVDRDTFRAEVARLSAIHLGKSLREIQMAALIRDLVQGAVQFDIEMPVEIVMVGKSLMTVEGIGRMLYPELDVLEEARPFFLRLLKERFSPEKLGSQLLRAATRFGGAAQDVPPLLAEVLDDLRRGQLRVHTEDRGLGQAAERLGRRIALGLIGTGFLGAGTMLYLHGHEGLGWTFFVAAGMSAVAAWGRLAATLRRKREPRRRST